jgi:selenium donor protein
VAGQVKLTAMAKAAGCAAKLNPATLDAVLRKLPRQTDPNVLVGFDTNDDAGIYLLGEGLALVQTVDFFTPIVDDPQLYGQIAAANALSDVYAMGGRPVSALSIVGFPEKSDPEILEQIIRGGLAKMNEAKCSIIGGHSIRNEDMFFGYAVTGVINPHRVWCNVGARAGDVLLFTKPLGTGVITTALKKDRATPQALAAAVTAMTTLNRAAATALQEIDESTASIVCRWRSSTRRSSIFPVLSKPLARAIFPEGSRITALSLQIALFSTNQLLSNIKTCFSTRKLRAACSLPSSPKLPAPRWQL